MEDDKCAPLEFHIGLRKLERTMNLTSWYARKDFVVVLTPEVLQQDKGVLPSLRRCPCTRAFLGRPTPLPPLPPFLHAGIRRGSDGRQRVETSATAMRPNVLPKKGRWSPMSISNCGILGALTNPNPSGPTSNQVRTRCCFDGLARLATLGPQIRADRRITVEDTE